MEEKTRTVIALSVIGLYIGVVITLMIWTMQTEGIDMGHFFDYLNRANFLLGPVGFVMGYYFKGTEENQNHSELPPNE